MNYNRRETEGHHLVVQSFLDLSIDLMHSSAIFLLQTHLIVLLGVQ